MTTKRKARMIANKALRRISEKTNQMTKEELERKYKKLLWEKIYKKTRGKKKWKTKKNTEKKN